MYLLKLQYLRVVLQLIQQMLNFLNDLKVGSAIRVQYEYEGIYNEVETAIGFHTVQRMDGKDIASNASYNTKQYARSLFGRKANGDIVLITVDMGKQ